MKVGIITLPLLSNYGCFLQNFALQVAIRKANAVPVTIDWVIPRQSLWLIMCSWGKTLLFRLFGKKRPFLKVVKPRYRSKLFDDFVQKNIIKTELFHGLKKKCVNSCDAVIVGSDQVWRPEYSSRIRDMFLDFCKSKKNLKRIAYAASFGVDNWVYSPKLTCWCRSLAKKFNAISVREESGVRLCKEHLDVDASWVLDPTLLLKKEDYLPVCENVPVCNEKYLAVYVLDENEQVIATYEKEANARGLVVKKFHADSKSTLTVPEWLAMFRDASYVVTDSFHGTVFSIIFGKEFKCIYNEERGATRFESLLNLYNSGNLEEMREFSLNWLKNALEN